MHLRSVQSCDRGLGHPLQVLRPVVSWPGNTDTIFSLAYDAPRNRTITGAKDSQVHTIAFSWFLDRRGSSHCPGPNPHATQGAICC